MSDFKSSALIPCPLSAIVLSFSPSLTFVLPRSRRTYLGLYFPSNPFSCSLLCELVAHRFLHRAIWQLSLISGRYDSLAFVFLFLPSLMISWASLETAIPPSSSTHAPGPFFLLKRARSIANPPLCTSPFQSLFHPSSDAIRHFFYIDVLLFHLDLYLFFGPT